MPKKEVIIDDVEDEPTTEDTPEASDTPIGRVERFSFKTNVNKGNMQHEAIELEYVLAPDEDLEEAFDYVRETALYLLEKNA